MYGGSKRCSPYQQPTSTSHTLLIPYYIIYQKQLRFCSKRNTASSSSYIYIFLSSSASNRTHHIGGYRLCLCNSYFRMVLNLVNLGIYWNTHTDFRTESCNVHIYLLAKVALKPAQFLTSRISTILILSRKLGHSNHYCCIFYCGDFT